MTWDVTKECRIIMVVDIEFMFYWSIYLTPSIWVCLESVEVSTEYRGLLAICQPNHYWACGSRKCGPYKHYRPKLLAGSEWICF